MSTVSQSCSLLDLPVELRLKIYEYLYQDQCAPQLYVRNGSRILQPMSKQFKHPGAGLPKTCRLIHDEAAPFMYSTVNFRIQMQIGNEWPIYQDAGPMNGSNPLLRQMQHLTITYYLIYSSHVEQALHLLRTLANTLDAAGAQLETLQVEIKATVSVEGRMSGRILTLCRDEMLEQIEPDAKKSSFRRMLEGMIITLVHQHGQ